MLVRIFSKEKGFIGLYCDKWDFSNRFFQASLFDRKFFNKNTIGIFVKKYNKIYDVIYIANNFFLCRTEYIEKL